MRAPHSTATQQLHICAERDILSVLDGFTETTRTLPHEHTERFDYWA